jgi:hypothetical protein
MYMPLNAKFSITQFSTCSKPPIEEEVIPEPPVVSPSKVSPRRMTVSDAVEVMLAPSPE